MRCAARTWGQIAAVLETGIPNGYTQTQYTRLQTLPARWTAMIQRVAWARLDQAARARLDDLYSRLRPEDAAAEGPPLMDRQADWLLGYHAERQACYELAAHA